MNLKYIKINLIVFIPLYLSIVIIISFISYNFFIKDFLELEEKQNNNNINKLLSSMNINIENIKNITNDYAEWDDTYIFLNTSTPDYIYKNFREGTNTLESLGLEFIIYSNLENRTIFSRYTNNILKKDRQDFEKELSTRFKKNTQLSSMFKYKTYVMYLVKSEIKKSDGKGDSNGYIFSGKIISNKNLKTMTPVFNKVSISDEYQKENDLILKFSNLNNVKVCVTHKNSLIINNIQVYDDRNNYMFSILTQHNRDIVNKGQKTIISFNIINSMFLFVIFYILYKKQSILESTIESKSKDLLEKQKIILQQSKMAAMGEMIENIAHQWRQPLSVISTTSTGAKLQNELGLLNENTLNSYFDSINNTAQYLSQTIEDFREFSNPQNNNIEEFKVSDVISKSLKLVSAQFIAEDIEIIENIEEFEIEAVENALVQVLINILNNAKDALLKVENQKRFIFINTYKDDSNLIIEIKDNANGIPEDLIDKIFEPYFTTKHQSQGIGIGLYMSGEIIHKHLKGTLSVKNTTYVYDNIKYTGAKFIIGTPLS